MRQASGTLEIATSGPRLYEFTRDVARWVGEQAISQGLLTIFCRHTSASLLIQENAAPEVKDDIVAFFSRIAPEDRSLYAHDDEGPDDMPAHLKTALTQVSLTVPLVDGRLALGTWQGIYLFEHRRQPHRRSVVLHLLGE
ncbi:secondary thiamine-phosphate synthase enzyme YjbQ [Sphingomonas crusticola]|uniref:secondary thiamine-phosphate synthase enzyme YjbQ n=1 Tax=Sphingomonas crusticola TaxID=1697973 RepID=UPI000E275397|nr:secondary thiamine-phosphate synthase enzyme YjbQ [Sphingomonas crusticola]